MTAQKESKKEKLFIKLDLDFFDFGPFNQKIESRDTHWIFQILNQINSYGYSSEDL